MVCKVELSLFFSLSLSLSLAFLSSSFLPFKLSVSMVMFHISLTFCDRCLLKSNRSDGRWRSLLLTLTDKLLRDLVCSRSILVNLGTS